MTDTGCTRVRSILHVASAPDPGDSDTLAVVLTGIHALLEGGSAGVSTDVTTSMVVAALNLELLVVSTVIVVFAGAGERLRSLRRRGGSTGGDRT